MKKILLVLAAILTVTFVGACQSTAGEELKLDTPYEYTGVTFVRPEGITLEQAKAMIPTDGTILVGTTINTIDDVENCIAQNLDKYSIRKMENGGVVVEYYVPLFEEVSINEEVITFKIGAGADIKNIILPYEQDGNKYTVTNEGELLEIYFKNGIIYYEKELLIEGYFIRYNHQIKQ